MARSGLRMMPTFPLLSLKFRTAGFPQYGFKAGWSDKAFPCDATLASNSLPASFVLPASLVGSPFCAGGRGCAGTPPFERLLPLYPRGPRSRLGSSVPVHPRLIGPIRPTRRRIPTSPLCGLYRMPSLCTLRLGDLRVVPRFRCPSFLTCRPLRPRGDRNRFVPDLRFRHRPSPCYERLGSPDYPAIRFTQGRLFGASWFAFAAACQVARPLCRSDQSSSGHRDFYLQASDESVTLLAAGYNYDSHWTVLSKGLSPFGMTTSVAAP